MIKEIILSETNSGKKKRSAITGKGQNNRYRI